MELNFRDDGRGLALKKLHEKGIAKGTLTRDASPQEIANSIFDSGTSTKENVTDISGRGVGMHAIKNFVERLNGSIEIIVGKPKDDRGEYSEVRFKIVIPLVNDKLSKAG